MTRQERVVEAIRGYWAEHGVGPSLRDLVAMTGISRTTVKSTVDGLRAAGEVTFRDRQPRTLKLVEHAETTRT